MEKVMSNEKGEFKCDICGYHIHEDLVVKTWVNEELAPEEHKRFVEMFGKGELVSCICCSAISNGFTPVSNVKVK